jgi:hypothetical protein
MLKDRLFYELGLLVNYQLSHNEIARILIKEVNPLTIEIDLLIKNNTYHFDVIFPQYFPYQPIIVKSLEKIKLSKHQYNDNSMCLKWGIDNWNEEITIKDILENLIELISIENPFGENHGIASSGDKFTLTQEIQRSGMSFIMDELDFELFKKQYGNGTFITKTTGHYILHFIKSVDKHKKHYSFKKFKSLTKFTYSKSDMSLEEFKINKLDQLANKMFKENDPAHLVISSDNKCLLAFIRFATEDEKAQALKKLSLVEQEKWKNEKPRVLEWITPKYINDEKEKRIQIDENVLNKKIAILGLGSVGSRVLLDLARAGFSNFILCDDDIFMPNNIVRHELFSDSIGEYKVVALSNRINKEINPKAFFDLHLFALNGQQSTIHTQHMLDNLATADLIIDCTANSNLIFSLNELVSQQDINYLSGSVISGGLGNILIIREKGKAISLVDLVESQKKFFRINHLEQFLTTDYSGKIGSTEYVATMSDISIISGIIGKNAIHLLSGKKEEILKSDIYIMSTSNQFLEETFSYYPLNGNKSSYKTKDLDKKIILLGKEYYDNHNTSRTS